ncbi:MAG: trypsin-like peptidase domain-containing protein, partial [Candidatus Omnitrophica bacterium]|nr:trypsin-like peptidase domain-containing protein [Candidatus Omnitrophota bacterium]
MNKLELRAIILSLTLFFVWSPFARAENNLQDQIYQARDKVFPALVHVQPISEVFQRGKKTKQTAVGSGVIVSQDGYVITNYHVAGKAVNALCTLENKERIPATLVGGDPLTDLAVLKLDLTDYKGPLNWAEIGDSNALVPGQFVLAMGSPLALSRSVSQGIVGCPDRVLDSELTLDDGEKTGHYNVWIQTTAAINPGNSGGPLVSLDGKVIGINTRTIMGADGLGFAIPSNVVKEVYRQIIDNGSVQRSWIGVELQPIEELAMLVGNPELNGVLVSNVEQGSPAKSAGILPGDLILSINDQPVQAKFEEEIPAVLQTISDFPIGSTLELEIARLGQTQEISLVTKEMGKTTGEEKEFKDWGISAQRLTLGRLLDLNRTSREGVLVSSVSGVTTRESTDLVKGDIILAVNGQDVNDMEDL